MARKTCPENFFEKISETLIEDNVCKGYHCLWGLVFDFEKSLTFFEFKDLIKFSSLLIRTTLPEVYYQLICTFKKIADETAFNTQLQCTL